MSNTDCLSECLALYRKSVEKRGRWKDIACFIYMKKRQTKDVHLNMNCILIVNCFNPCIITLFGNDQYFNISFVKRKKNCLLPTYLLFQMSVITETPKDYEIKSFSRILQFKIFSLPTDWGGKFSQILFPNVIMWRFYCRDWW